MGSGCTIVLGLQEGREDRFKRAIYQRTASTRPSQPYVAIIAAVMNWAENSICHFRSASVSGAAFYFYTDTPESAQSTGACSPIAQQDVDFFCIYADWLETAVMRVTIPGSFWLYSSRAQVVAIRVHVRTRHLF